MFSVTLWSTPLSLILAGEGPVCIASALSSPIVGASPAALPQVTSKRARQRRRHQSIMSCVWAKFSRVVCQDFETAIIGSCEGTRILPCQTRSLDDYRHIGVNHRLPSDHLVSFVASTMVDQNQQPHSSPNVSVKKEARDPAGLAASGSKPKKPRVSTGERDVSLTISTLLTALSVFV